MASPVYRFGDFRLEPASRELWRGEDEVSLPRKAFDCLLYLIERRERAVEREELFQAVWGDVQLSDNVLHQAIFEARRALQDTGDEQRFIKTVRAFGYRWAGAVEIVDTSDAANGESFAPPLGASPPTDTAGSPVMPEESAPVPRSTRAQFVHRPVWVGVTLALLAVGVTGGTAYWSRQGPDAEPSPPPAAPRKHADIALVLPVTLENGARNTWMRLGLMDLIAERLRLAGQPTVPSDTVVALARGMGEEPGAAELEALANRTGARLILGARVEAVGSRWRVSLHALRGARPRLTTFGEADNALAAAGIAGDRVALLLGRTPAPALEAPPGVQALLQRINATLLDQRLDVARALIEDAEPELRRHPEVRLLRGHVELASGDLEAAASTLGSLLRTERLRRDPILRSRVLDQLAGVHVSRGEYRIARRHLEDAVRLLSRQDTPNNLGRVHLLLGYVALSQGGLDEARTQAAQARRLLDSMGDVRGLGLLYGLRGNTEALRENWVDALASYERAAEIDAAMGRLAGELVDRANIVLAHVNLLDPLSALAQESRLRELLSRVESPGVVAYAKLARAYALLANGRSRAGERQLAEVLRTTNGRDGLEEFWLAARVLDVELASEKGGVAEAADAAASVIEGSPPGLGSIAEDLGRARLILVRAELKRGRLDAADEAVASLEGWAKRSPFAAPKIYAALARAELAAARSRSAPARAAFERALEIADAHRTPKRVLEVASTYVAWLLSEGKTSDLERAEVVADRIARYAERDYSAALLLLRLYHSTGPPSAWHTAAARARSLSGEREIEPDLLRAPRDFRLVSRP